jgi:hypothetical protein
MRICYGADVPDPLDPTDAFFSAFTGMWLRTLAFLAVSGGAALAGLHLHEAPALWAQLNAGGWPAVWAAAGRIDASLALVWLGIMTHSFFIPWTLPFVLGWLALLWRLWREADLFTVLFFTGLLQALHVFIYRQSIAPLRGGELAWAVGLLLVFLPSAAALVLWWRHTSIQAPELPDREQEPEL